VGGVETEGGGLVESNFSWSLPSPSMRGGDPAGSAAAAAQTENVERTFVPFEMKAMPAFIYILLSFLSPLSGPYAT